MRIFILILVIVSIIGVLESQAIIPQSPYSILGALNSAAVFIRSLNIQSYYLIIPDIVITPKGILSLLLIFFIIGYLYERFRELEQNNLILKKQIHKLTTDITSIKSVDITDNHQSNKDSEMKEIAEEIRNFLSTLAESVTINPSTPIRTKKIRRVQAENLSDTSASSEIEMISQASDIQSTSKVDVQPYTDSNTSDIRELNAGVEQSQDDDNLSSIDLARALIESGEKEKAKEIIMNVIKTGTSDQAHEARLLNLQIS